MTMQRSSLRAWPLLRASPAAGCPHCVQPSRDENSERDLAGVYEDRPVTVGGLAEMLENRKAVRAHVLLVRQHVPVFCISKKMHDNALSMCINFTGKHVVEMARECVEAAKRRALLSSDVRYADEEGMCDES